MRYFIDTEFNGFGGELLSMALVREDGQSVYLRVDLPEKELDPWVAEKVWPIMNNSPVKPLVVPIWDRATWAKYLAAYLPLFGPKATVIADWPDDIRYLCDRLITGPGQMVNIPGIKFEVVRVNAYPTKLDGAVQHNAWWDAMALREVVMNPQYKKYTGREELKVEAA